MCGFLGQIGTINIDSKKDFINAFNLLNHRGPDFSNLYESSNIILGHKRLSIIDLDDRSNQPFTDGNNSLLYNGEIYNFRSIRKFLAKKYNHTFDTEGDTEVLFVGLKKEGLDFLNRIDGMFALCFINREGKILLARDKFGQKPLFYGFKNDDFITCSELAPLKKIFKRDYLTINIEAIKKYLMYGATIAPSTIYNEIFQVSPGEIMEIDVSNKNILKRNLSKTCEVKKNLSIKDALEKRLESCLVSDTPIAFLSSGGIDSSALITSMSSIKNPQSKIAIHLKTNEDKRGVSIAKKLETDDLPLKVINHKRSINQKDINTLIERFEEPFADTSYFYSEDLYSSISGKYKVIIGGDGADEAFFGYRPKFYFYISSKISSLFPVFIRLKLISITKKFGKFGFYFSLALGYKKSIEKVLMGFDSDELNQLIKKTDKGRKKDQLLTGKEILDFYDNYLMTRLSNVFMKKSDHASMKFSKELRSPYLQSDLREFRSMINFVDNFITKFKLKMFLLRSLGISDIFRKKIGFNIISKDSVENKKENILRWSQENKSTLELIFDYDIFIALVKNSRQERYLFRLQVLISWLESFYEKRK